MLKRYFMLLSFKEELQKDQTEAKASGDKEKEFMIGAQIQTIESTIRIEKELNEDAVREWQKNWFGE